MKQTANNMSPWKAVKAKTVYRRGDIVTSITGQNWVCVGGGSPGSWTAVDSAYIEREADCE